MAQEEKWGKKRWHLDTPKVKATIAIYVGCNLPPHTQASSFLKCPFLGMISTFDAFHNLRMMIEIWWTLWIKNWGPPEVWNRTSWWLHIPPVAMSIRHMSQLNNPSPNKYVARCCCFTPLNNISQTSTQLLTGKNHFPSQTRRLFECLRCFWMFQSFSQYLGGSNIQTEKRFLPWKLMGYSSATLFLP